MHKLRKEQHEHSSKYLRLCSTQDRVSYMQLLPILHSQKADRVVSTSASIYTAADRMSCVTWSWTFDVIVNLPGKHSVTVKLRPSGVTVAWKSNQSLKLSSVCHCQAESY